MGYLKIIGIVVVVTFIGGAYAYVDRLQEKNGKLRENVATLKGSILQLEVSIKDLKEERQRLSRDAEEARMELALIRIADETSRKEVSELKSRITVTEKLFQLDRVSRSRGASLHLQLVNKGAKCQWEHFDDFTGECRGGRWTEDQLKQTAKVSNDSN